MSDSFWDDAAAVEVPAPPAATFVGLPDKANVILRTTTSAEKETCQPKLRDIARNDGSGNFYMLKVPMQVIGGDAKINATHVGKGYFFPEFNVEKPTAEQLEARIAKADADGFESTSNRLKGQLKSLDAFPCGPECYNLLLDCLSPEGESTQARWQSAAAQLKVAAEKAGLTLEACKGNSQYLVVAAFHALLMETAYTVIGATYTPKNKPGSNFEARQTVGSIGSFTEAEAKRRKVRLIEAEAKEGF